MPAAARLAVLAPLLVASPAGAQAIECANVRVDMTPTDSLQLVAWVERPDGTFVDTLYITAKTGFYGLGNRPGRFDFNSGPFPDAAKGIDEMWPYGRRINVFPVWAHRHGLEWPEVVFQDGREDNLSHAVDQSSIEPTPPYCRPMSRDGNSQCWLASDKQIWDTGSCATTVYTDKGVLHPTLKSKYPPRGDLTTQAQDSGDVASYAALNPFDAVTRATPKGGEPMTIRWTPPSHVDPGDYVLFVEASKSFDFNETYNASTYPEPTNISYGACGEPYRGQPSVVYRVPFRLGMGEDIQLTQTYAGYGDVNGANGTLNPPDATITTETPGSGALRLQLVSDNNQMYRARVRSILELDYAPPGAVSALEPVVVGPTSATLQFIEPGDDDAVGSVARYEVRVRANEPITDDNFESSQIVVSDVEPLAAGELANLEIKGLLPETVYYVAVRAHDDCPRQGAITTTSFTTSDRVVGEVDACFIATAAYGSLMANDVGMLRRFRDGALRTSVFGELAVATYYTFGPAVAGVVGESDMLRETARAALAPVIERVKRHTF